jgi:tetratricopeptide (TPR) repeat protein
MEPRYQEELMRNYVNFAMDTRFEEEKRRDYLEKATLVAKKLLSLYPENNAAYFTLGMVEHLQNRTDQAVNYYKKGLELQPYVADMHNNLGLAYLSKGDFKKAAKHFLAAVYCNYRHPQFLERFATASLHAFGYKETKKRVKEIIQNFGLYHYPYVYIVLGWLAFQGGDLNLAEACNLEVLKLQEKHLAAHRNLAIIYYRKREYQKAYEYYSKVLDLSPTDREAQHMVRLLSSMLKKR